MFYMSSKEVDKMIDNVLASFKMDGIEVPLVFIDNARDNLLLHSDEKKPLSRRLEKRRTDEYDY